MAKLVAGLGQALRCPVSRKPKLLFGYSLVRARPANADLERFVHAVAARRVVPLERVGEIEVAWHRIVGFDRVEVAVAHPQLDREVVPLGGVEGCNERVHPVPEEDGHEVIELSRRDELRTSLTAAARISVRPSSPRCVPSFVAC